MTKKGKHHHNHYRRHSVGSGNIVSDNTMWSANALGPSISEGRYMISGD